MEKVDKHRAFIDIGYFARACVPEYACDDIPRFHQTILGVIQNPKNRKVSVVAPRGFAKSTLTQVYVLWRLAFSPIEEKDYIIIVSESQQQAIDYLENIKAILEDGTYFRKAFGDLVGDRRWGAESIVTANNVKVECLGTRQRIRGRNWGGIRPKLIILDDFESEQNSGSAEDRQRVRKWIRAAVMPAIRKGTGRIFLIGTIIHEDAYLARVHSSKRNNWKKLFFRSQRFEGDPHPELYGRDNMLWPEPHKDQDGHEVSFGLEWFKNLRQEYMNDGQLDMFMQEYCNSIQPGDPVFESEDLKTYADFRIAKGQVEIQKREDGPWVPCQTFLGVDPSTRQHERADWCVLMPVAVDDGGTIYQLPYKRERYGRDVHRIVAEIFDLDSMYNFTKVAVEVVGAQVYIMGELQRQMAVRNRYFSVAEQQSKKGKDSKIFSLQPRFKSGKLMLNPSAVELVHELIHYGKARHDDTADALWMACEIAYPMGGLSLVGSDIPRYRHGFSWKVA